MLILHALLRIDRAPPSSVSLLFCAFALCILRKYLQTNARKPQRLSNFFKTWVVKVFLRIIWVNIARIFVGKLGENCQSSLVFCGYDDWRSDKAENYTRRGTDAPASNNEIRSAINTLSLHSVFVGQDCVEKITKHTRNYPARQLVSLKEVSSPGIFSTITYGQLP